MVFPTITGGRFTITTGEVFSTLVIDDVDPSDAGRFDVTVENRLGSDTASAYLAVEGTHFMLCVKKILFKYNLC